MQRHPRRAPPRSAPPPQPGIPPQTHGSRCRYRPRANPPGTGSPEPAPPAKHRPYPRAAQEADDLLLDRDIRPAICILGHEKFGLVIERLNVHTVGLRRTAKVDDEIYIIPVRGGADRYEPGVQGAGANGALNHDRIAGPEIHEFRRRGGRPRPSFPTRCRCRPRHLQPPNSIRWRR